MNGLDRFVAEEELENVSRNYLRNLNCSTAQVPYQNDALQKNTWTENAQLNSEKLKNGRYGGEGAGIR